ncbi:MAG: hypothetical protein AAGE84_09525 [Cyanobacteria bacterium P01_G01_bin.39]
MGQNSLYAIGIGGTGAKCLEAIAQLAAVGLFADTPIKLLFVDADETNGSLERAKDSLSIYRKCQKLLAVGGNSSWLKTPIKLYYPDLWSPFGKTNTNKDLASFYSYNNLQQNPEGLGNLFDVLYTEEERKASLDVGFRGRPAIGSAVMSHLDLDNLEDDPWASLTQDILADVGSGNSPRIFLCGSIFGGTGASGLPTLGRLIYNKLEKEKIQGAKISCLFVLPYFRFPQPTGKDAANQEVYARSEQFLLNTEAALRYYVNQNQNFHTVYLLGNQNLSNYQFSIGKNTQKNEPHFIEVYSALAARHFLLDTPSRENTVVINSRQNSQRITWQDLPDSAEVQSNLVNATRFAYVWLSNILPELNTAAKIGVASFQKGAPWFVEFYRPSQGVMGKWFDRRGEDLPDFNDDEQKKAIDIITEWCQDYLRWLSEVHQCDGDDIELFRYRAFANLGNDLQGEYLSELVIGDKRDSNAKKQDTIQQLKLQLESITSNSSSAQQGTIGLAKALYQLCRL